MTRRPATTWSSPAIPSGGDPMKLLALEAAQLNLYFLSRYRQVVDLGAELFILNGEGAVDYWPAGRYRIAGSKHVDRIVEAARAWHARERFDGVFTFSESAVVATAAVAGPTSSSRSPWNRGSFFGS